MNRIPVFTMLLILSTGALRAQVEAGLDALGDVETTDGATVEAAEGTAQGRMGKTVDLAGTGVGAVVAAEELYSDWQALDAAEADCGSAYTNAGPVVPSQCAESAACRQCYESAVRSIDFNRFYAERAYCVTAAALKMAKSATAFGDSASGFHGMMGLSWQLQGKPQIKEATESLKKTYKSKASQYLNGLDRALKKLGQCEAEHFGEQDWYARYGWMYLSFMKARYEPVPAIPD